MTRGCFSLRERSTALAMSRALSSHSSKRLVKKVRCSDAMCRKLVLTWTYLSLPASVYLAHFQFCRTLPKTLRSRIMACSLLCSFACETPENEEENEDDRGLAKPCETL